MRSGFLGRGMGPNAFGGGAADWWVVAGQTCVAAYQPIGAVDLATSYINLANPGVYDAAPVVAPTLGAAGWIFSGSTQHLASGISTPGAAWTLLLLCTTAGAGGSNAGRAIMNGDALSFGVVPNALTACWIANGSSLTTNPAITSTPTVIGFAAKSAYINGIAAGSIGAGAPAQNELLIGNNASLNRGMNGTIAAVAIYSTTLSAADVAALTARVAALA